MSLFQFTSDQSPVATIGNASAHRSIEAAMMLDASVYKDLEQMIPGLNEAFNIFFINDAKFSTHQLIGAILTQMKWADVYISTYGINENSMRQIANRKMAGHIRNLYFLFSDQVKRIKPQEIQIAMQIATAYCIYPCHAKIVAMQNDTHQVLIVSSMNLNRNNKLEAGAMTNDPKTVQAFIDFMNDKICTQQNNSAK